MKKPLFSLRYDEGLPENLTECGMEYATCLGVEGYSTIPNADARNILEHTYNLQLKETLEWIERNKHTFSPTTAVVSMRCDTPQKLTDTYATNSLQCIVLQRPLHTIPHLDDYLNACNTLLVPGGYMLSQSRTAILKRLLIQKKYPPVVRQLMTSAHYLWHRVFPKIRGLKKIYFGITRGTNRTYNRVELLGRSYRAGFEVIDEEFRFNHYFLFCRKTKEPIWDDTPSESPIIKLPRVGKNGAIIGVYKFRTMYSYSEYIQGYIYQHNNLQQGGKFADDYRINFWGRHMRKLWLDELPMIINVLKGQMKLVGVRPLSRHYFSLYNPEMQDLRITVKPGLIPPFYYEASTPKTIDEVQESERRYIEAYEQHPFATDWRYFWGSLFNILFRKKRSK